MSFDFSNEVPETMHDVLKSAVDIVNDDFDYYKFMRAFSQNDPWNNPSASLPTLSPKVSRRETSMENDALKSCPSFRQPVFTFDETSSPPKQSRYNGSSQNYNSGGKIKRAETEIMNPSTQGVNMKEPILKLQITGNPNYQLDESDILSIFSRYGNVQQIELGKYRTAFIIFDNGMNALTAQKLLHGQYIKHLDIKLYLSWTNAIEGDLLRVEENQPTRNISPPNAIHRNEYPTFPGNVSKTLPSNLGSSVPSFPYNSAKYTCKYEVQIDNDKDFKIARKIIGPKGCNMKKIIEICQFHLKRSDIIFQSDFLKLRLRGRGSGFKEGPEQKESADPLHLCVSSKYPEVYNLACKLVEDLLTGLYKEYETVCSRAGRPLAEPVQIKRIEIYNGSNEKKPSEDAKVSSLTSLHNSGDFNQNFTRSLNLSNNESSNNSLSSLSDPENNEALVQLEDSDAKSL